MTDQLHLELAEFNSAPTERVREVLSTCLDIPRWCDEVLAGRPFPDVDAVVDLAARAAEPLLPEEIDRALSHHPRIGERPAGTGAGARMSASEQSGVASAGDYLTVRLRAGNLAYEQRFGRVFLIRAARRDASEILAALEQRLGNDEATELAVVAEQLREIAVLRLRGVLEPGSDPATQRGRITTHVLDTALGVPARGVPVQLQARTETGWSIKGTASTDDDGRVGTFNSQVARGRHRLVFDTAAYLQRSGRPAFFPEVIVTFEVGDESHYHVPILLSPFGYSTYRGS